MKKFLTLTALIMLVSATGSGQQGPLPEQGAPPSELTERDGFVSANNAPITTENFEVHVVEEGDTLWDIARRYLNNSFLWPQLWESNEHIINPHWIYPQDQILIRAITQITQAVEPQAPEPVVDAEPEPEPVAQVRLPATPQLTPESAPAPPPVIFELPDLRERSAVHVRAWETWECTT